MTRNNFERVLFVILLIVGVALTLNFSKAYAGSIPDSEAVVITWQKSNGMWKSCGPVQRLSLSENTEDIAIDRVTGSVDYINMRFEGWYQNEYKVYRLYRDLKQGDFDARKCVR